MRIGLYAHGGSGNHGCEALVRSCIKLLGNHEFTLLSERPNEDAHYGLDQQLRILPSQNNLPKGLGYLVYSAEMKLFRKDHLYWRWRYRGFGKKTEGLDLALAIGGDNYCYRGFTERFSVLNRALVKKGIPCILWGCSIDEERINAALLTDLRRYRLIVARESITFNTLKQCGLKNVRLMPDVAFLLEGKAIPLPDGFVSSKMVGLNISPLIESRESVPGGVMQNYRTLVHYILTQTDMGIAFIPHVVWKGNDDRTLLHKLYEETAPSGRVVMIGDDGAMALKEVIRRCRFLVAARTHASIAGYSTGVPTLTIGYSVKSRGIAKDLFGASDHYVLPVEEMKTGDELKDAFVWLMNHEENIRSYYDAHLRNYIGGLKSDILYEGF